MKKLFVGAAIFAALTMTACSSNPMKSGSMSYDETVAEAKAQHAKAKEYGNVWQQKKMKMSYVEHYLAEAEKAKQAGNQDKAMKMAKEALKTANAEVAQSEDNQGLKPAWIKD